MLLSKVFRKSETSGRFEIQTILAENTRSQQELPLGDPDKKSHRIIYLMEGSPPYKPPRGRRQMKRCEVRNGKPLAKTVNVYAGFKKKVKHGEVMGLPKTLLRDRKIQTSLLV